MIAAFCEKIGIEVHKLLEVSHLIGRQIDTNKWEASCFDTMCQKALEFCDVLSFSNRIN